MIFQKLSFQIQAGEAMIIEGANGAGKSSLLRIMAGIAAPAEGSVYWNHELIQQSDYHCHLHYLSHQNGLKLGLTIEENLQLISKLCNTPPQQDIDAVLTTLQLPNKTQLVCHLSAGQRRRVALAKLLLFPKTIWILDEPFTALDRDTQSYLLTAINEHLANDGLAMISSHHALPINPSRRKELYLSAKAAEC